MKKLRLATKISIITTIAILLTAAAIGTSSIIVSSSRVSEMINESLDTTELGVLDTLDNWREILEASTLVFADKTRLVTALTNRDNASVVSLHEEQVKVLNTDFLIVTDERGFVITGAKRGVNLADLFSVSGALRGEKSWAYEESEFFDYSLVVAYPMKNNGKVVGTVLGGFSLANEEFTEEIKNFFKVECTIFSGDTRVMTTLGDDLIGTQLDNRAIVDQVLNKGVRFEGQNTIAGIPYFTIYTPLEDEHGNITGMLFTAKPVSILNSVVMNITQSMIAVIAIIALLLGVVVTIFLGKLVKPLLGVKETLDEISNGEADLTKRIEIKSHDEIGDVVNGFNTFSGKLQNIIGDVKESKDELLSAGKGLAAATNDTSSSITQIIAIIQSMNNQISTQSQSVSQTAGAVNEIASNIESLERMIESQASGVTQASAAVEEMIGNIQSVN